MGKHQLFWGLLTGCLFFSQSVGYCQEAEHNDTVTLKNGDIHLGRLRHSDFRFVTPYGTIVLSEASPARLSLRNGANGQDLLFTSDGGRISGRLQSSRIVIERAAFAPLTLNVEDIMEIRFAAPASVFPAAPDAVEMQNGDILPGEVTTRGFQVKTPVGMVAISKDEIRVIDVDTGNALRARLTLKQENRRLRGNLRDSHLQFRVHGGQETRLPLSRIAMIEFNRSDPQRATPAAHHPPQKANVFRDPLRDGGLGPEMVVIPAGTFQRGDLHGDGDSDERPVKTVRIPRPFALGRFPVTFEEYDRFCEATGHPKPADEGWGRGRRPVVNVTWPDAVAYARWLSQQTGKRYRLPTNSEWEYAAKAGSTARYWWGEDVGSDNANCAGCDSIWDGSKTSPVGKFPPNPFGLYDMGGNVWQWVQDCWDQSYENAPTDGSAYVTGDFCDKRIIRGGAWSFPPREVRAANRWRDFAARISDDTGFRVARDW
jgi:formylglycine-generating enzyme required for sulfatase activity